MPDAAKVESGSVRRSRALVPHDNCHTPQGLFWQLQDEFGPFEVDVAADADNALCERYFDEANNGLIQPWAPSRCWMNPPYSNIDPWTRKAAQEARNGALVVALLPARVEQRWFHRDVLAVDAEVRFIRGRLRFGIRGRMGRDWTAPFASIVVIWHPACHRRRADT